MIQPPPESTLFPYTTLFRSATVTAPEIQEALHDGLMTIIAATKEVLEKTPPELSADIIDRGIMLTGGGALLKNIDKLISYYLKVPVLTADHPLEAVALGTGILLKHIEKHQRHKSWEAKFRSAERREGKEGRTRW